MPVVPLEKICIAGAAQKYDLDQLWVVLLIVLSPRSQIIMIECMVLLLLQQIGSRNNRLKVLRPRKEKEKNGKRETYAMGLYIGFYLVLMVRVGY